MGLEILAPGLLRPIRGEFSLGNFDGRVDWPIRSATGWTGDAAYVRESVQMENSVWAGRYYQTCRLCCSRLRSLLIGCFNFRRHAIIHKLHDGNFMIHAMKCIIGEDNVLKMGLTIQTPYTFVRCRVFGGAWSASPFWFSFAQFAVVLCLTNWLIPEVREVWGNVTLTQFHSPQWP